MATDTEQAGDLPTLGTFGTPMPEEQAAALDVRLAFEWYGDTVRVHPHASMLDLMEFMSVAGDLDDGDVAVIPPLMRLLKSYVHPEDWQRPFWRNARAHHATTIEFMELVRGVVEWISERPTEPQPDSTDGPRPTGASSTHGLSSQDVEVIGRLAAQERADLAGFVIDRATYDQERQQA